MYHLSGPLGAVEGYRPSFEHTPVTSLGGAFSRTGANGTFYTIAFDKLIPYRYWALTFDANGQLLKKFFLGESGSSSMASISIDGRKGEAYLRSGYWVKYFSLETGMALTPAYSINSWLSPLMDESTGEHVYFDGQRLSRYDPVTGKTRNKLFSSAVTNLPATPTTSAVAGDILFHVDLDTRNNLVHLLRINLATEKVTVVATRGWNGTGYALLNLHRTPDGVYAPYFWIKMMWDFK